MVYPKAVRSKSPPTEGVFWVSTMWIKEPEAARWWEGRRFRREKEERRELDTDGRRCGDLGAGEPG